MFESLFEFFFKYRPLMFQQGDFALRASWLGLLAVAVAAWLALVILRTYSQVRGNSQPLDRTILTAVRIATLTVLVFLLLRPVLVLSFCRTPGELPWGADRRLAQYANRRHG